jgi:hypothetical protein
VEGGGLPPLPQRRGEGAASLKPDAVRLRIVAGEIFHRERCHLRRLVDGPWDAADVLVLQPGQRAAPTLGHEVIVAGAGPR